MKKVGKNKGAKLVFFTFYFCQVIVKFKKIVSIFLAILTYNFFKEGSIPVRRYIGERHKSD